MEGMEGMEGPAGMRFFGSTPCIHTRKVWNVSGSMRDRMPATAAFIDDLRAAFGTEQINGAISSGIKGRPHFWASENGNELGTWWPACGERDDGTASDD
jgi:hypothetical protein